MSRGNSVTSELLPGSKKKPSAVGLHDCAYCADKKFWIGPSNIHKLTVGDRKKLKWCRFLLEKAPSGMSRCRKCGNRIEKGEMRLAYPKSDVRGEYHILSCWLHLGCANHLIVPTLEEVWRNEQPQNLTGSTFGDAESGDEVFKAEENIHPDHLENSMKVESDSENKNVKLELDKCPSVWDLEFLSKVMEQYCCGWNSGSPPADWQKLTEKDEMEENDDGDLDAAVKRKNMEAMKAPEELTVPLLLFQSEGLAWMVKQEDRGRATRGGILADEMGMGKTIQTIALLLKNKVYGDLHPDRPKHCGDSDADVEASRDSRGSSKKKTGRESGENVSSTSRRVSSSSRKSPAKGSEKKNSKTSKPERSSDELEDSDDEPISTVVRSEAESVFPRLKCANLVVCPNAAVIQWKNEIEKFSKPGSLRVVIYHGQKRKHIWQDLSRYDVVLTTYPTIEAEYRKIMSATKLTCKYCGRKFLPQKLAVHYRYYCGPAAERTKKQAKQEKRKKAAARKGLETLGIGVGSAPSDEPKPPTIRNVYRELMMESGNFEEAETMLHAPWLRYGKIRRKTIPEDENVNAAEGESVENNTSEAFQEEDENFNLSGRRSVKRRRITAAVTDSAAESTSANSLPDEWMDAFCRLLEMGYEESSIKQALENSSGNLAQASEFLTGASSVESIPQLARRKVIRDRKGSIKVESSSRSSSSRHASTKDLRAKWRDELGVSKSGLTSIKVARLREVATALKMKSEIVNSVKADLVKKLGAYLFEEGHDSFAESSESEAVVEPARRTGRNRPGVSSPPDSRRASAPVVRNSPETGKSEGGESEESASVIGHRGRRKSAFSSRSNLFSDDEVDDGREDDTIVQKKSRKPVSVISRIGKRKSSARTISSIHSGTEDDDSSHSDSDNDGSDYTDSDRDFTSNDTGDELDASQARLSDSSSEELISAKSNKGRKASPKKSAVKVVTNSKPKGKQEKKASPSKASPSKASPSKASPSKSTSSSISKSEYRTFDDGHVDISKFQREGMVEDSHIDLSSSPLLSMRWRRIILDEAHRIKARTSNTANAIFALECIGSRWCLTGTPLQNRVSDLYALIRFLRHYPYAFYFCSRKGCDCFNINYRFTNSKCTECEHSSMSHFSYFNRTILKPIVDYGYVGEGKKATIALRQDILNELLLRRTKLERAADVKLPPLVVTIRTDKLSPQEKDFYESLYKQSRTTFDDYVERGVVLYNYAHIFDILSRLRQAVDHPYLILHGSLATERSLRGEAPIPSKSHGNCDVCALCLEDVVARDAVTAKCKHTFHLSCARELMETCVAEGGEEEAGVVGCPSCYAPLTIDFSKISSAEELTGVSTTISSESSTPDQPTSTSGSFDEDREKIIRKEKYQYKKSILSRIDMKSFTSSTKIEALVAELKSDFESDPECKAIVFSQFTAMLDLIEWRIKKEGVNCAKLTGSLSLEGRGNLLHNFNVKPDFKVILISLKAGGEGLNLQVANRIYIMDPWWNPATEMQAIQRAHRIGQTKPVKAVRFIAEGTVEEKMLQLQEKKQLVFDGTIASSGAAMAKLNGADLKFLFA